MIISISINNHWRTAHLYQVVIKLLEYFFFVIVSLFDSMYIHCLTEYNILQFKKYILTN
jgi:hypothetical protein